MRPMRKNFGDIKISGGYYYLRGLDVIRVV
jgi:hypothetical protein